MKQGPIDIIRVITDMYQRLILLAFFTMFTAMVSFSSVTMAAGKDEDLGVKDKLDKDGLPGIFARDEYGIDLLQDLSQKEGTFYLRLYNLGEVTGCVNKSSSKGTDFERQDVLDIKVRDSQLILKKRQARYSPYDCEIKRHGAYIDVRLNKNSLLRDGIKKIAISSEKYGRFNSIDIDVTEEKIEIYDQDETYTMWFYPKNSVILTAKDAPVGAKNIIKSLKEYGKKNGMTPLEDVLEGYELPYYAEDFALFVDTKNFVRDQLKTANDMKTVGTIQGTQRIHGPNGLEDEVFDMHVSARIPGEDFNWYKRTPRKPAAAKSKE